MFLDSENELSKLLTGFKKYFYFPGRDVYHQSLAFLSKSIFALLPACDPSSPSSLSVIQPHNLLTHHLPFLLPLTLVLNQDSSLPLLASLTHKVISSESTFLGESLRYFPALPLFMAVDWLYHYLMYASVMLLRLILPVDYKLWKANAVPF